MPKLAIMCEHFATGGMPAIVTLEAEHLPDYDIDLFILNRTGCDVHLKQIEQLPNVTIHEPDSEVVKPIVDLGVNFVVQHDVGNYREQLQREGIQCIAYTHSPGFWSESLRHAPQADRYLAVSPLVKHMLEQRGVTAPIEVINTPIDTKRFKPANADVKYKLRSERGISPDDFVVIHCGVWCENKNQKGAITIFNQLRKRVRNARLLLVGGMYANFQAYWEEVMDNHGRTPGVYFIGETDKPEVFYQMADAYISTSHIEGCSNSIREAAACGLPCVINDNASNQSCFNDSPFIFASTDNNGKSFVDALAWLYSSVPAGMPKESRKYVKAKYGIKRYTEQIRRIYEEIKPRPLTHIIRELPQDEFIFFDSKALGDTLAWLPAVIEYQKQTDSNIKIFTFHNDFLAECCPELDFVDAGYNAYSKRINIGCYDDGVPNWRDMPLKEVAIRIFGVDKVEPLQLTGIAGKVFSRPTVCISEHATMKAKLWNYPGGWQEVVNSLFAMDYNVAVISKEQTQLTKVIDLTGDIPLTERARQLADCEFFIGVSSGLAWLANAVGKHVFMINGCTYAWNEFQDNITTIERLDVCRGCINRPEDFVFEKYWEWCPSGKDFQCTKYITPQMVIDAISRQKKRSQ